MDNLEFDALPVMNGLSETLGLLDSFPNCSVELQSRSKVDPMDLFIQSSTMDSSVLQINTDTSQNSYSACWMYFSILCKFGIGWCIGYTAINVCIILKTYNKFWQIFKVLISFYLARGKWRKSFKNYAVPDHHNSVVTVTFYMVGNLGPNVSEKKLKSHFKLTEKNVDKSIIVAADPKKSSSRLALLRIPFHQITACNLQGYDKTIFEGRNITVKEVKNRKYLIWKDFRLMTPKPNVFSAAEWEMVWSDVRCSEYSLIDGSNGLVKLRQKDISKILDRAVAAGVRAMVLTCSSIMETKKAVKICEQYPGYLYFTAGVRPENLDQWKTGCLSQLEKLARHPQCVAIGECGLSLPSNDRIKQIRIFRLQIDLACRLQKPLWFCSLGSDYTIAPILEMYRHRLPGMCVGEYRQTNGKLPMISLWEFVRMGCLVSITAYSKDSAKKSWWKTLLDADLISPENIILISEADSNELEYYTYKELCQSLDASETTYLKESSVALSSAEDMYEVEPCCMPVQVELLSASLRCQPGTLAAASNKNAEQFFNFR